MSALVLLFNDIKCQMNDDNVTNGVIQYYVWRKFIIYSCVISVSNHSIQYSYTISDSHYWMYLYCDILFRNSYIDVM